MFLLECALILLITSVWELGPAFIALFAAVALWASSAGIDLHLSQLIALLGLASSIPVSAYLAGALLDHYAFGDLGSRPFRLILSVVSLWLLLDSSDLPNIISSAVHLLHMQSARGCVLLIAALLSAMAFCACVVALCAMLVSTLFEFSARLLLASGRSRFYFPFSALRPFVIVGVLTISCRLATDLFITELNPSKFALQKSL